MSNGDDFIGVFIGLESASYEYLANIIAPYRSDLNIDIGSLLLIENGQDQLVARVMEYVPFGELMSFMGQKWLSDVALEADKIGQDIKNRKIRYQIRIKVLGTLNRTGFNAGLKTIPHITSRVSKPDTKKTIEIINMASASQAQGIEIGSYFLDNKIRVNFDLAQINERRTFVFAHAGYGKTNLVKMMGLRWKNEYGGLLVFDPEGEYAITDKKNRPGIMDGREAILATNRKIDGQIKNVYRNLKLNLKSLSPKFAIPILVSEGKHDMVFFSALMGMEQPEWNSLVDVFYEHGWGISNKEVNDTVFGSSLDEQKIVSIKNNLIGPIRSLHDPQSRLLEITKEAMGTGNVMIIDISLLDTKSALQLSSILVRQIFNHNQDAFTGSSGNLLKANFVVEEAQSVLGGSSNDTTFVELSKEGRKYSLGAVFVTQQPGSISPEIVSQGDNFFMFHMINSSDLEMLKRVNAHYSRDIITQILNEPVKGKCYLWTSEQPFVIPVMIDLIEDKLNPNEAATVQSSSTLLGDILAKVEGTSSNPVLISILQKYVSIENTNKGVETGKKTIALFKQLDDDEKEFLRKQDRLQSNRDGTEFAIRIKYYTSLAQMQPILDSMAKQQDSDENI